MPQMVGACWRLGSRLGSRGRRLAWSAFACAEAGLAHPAVVTRPHAVGSWWC